MNANAFFNNIYYIVDDKHVSIIHSGNENVIKALLQYSKKSELNNLDSNNRNFVERFYGDKNYNMFFEKNSHKSNVKIYDFFHNQNDCNLFKSILDAGFNIKNLENENEISKTCLLILKMDYKVSLLPEIINLIKLHTNDNVANSINFNLLFENEHHSLEDKSKIFNYFNKVEKFDKSFIFTMLKYENKNNSFEDIKNNFIFNFNVLLNLDIEFKNRGMIPIGDDTTLKITNEFLIDFFKYSEKKHLITSFNDDDFISINESYNKLKKYSNEDFVFKCLFNYSINLDEFKEFEKTIDFQKDNDYLGIYLSRTQIDEDVFKYILNKYDIFSDKNIILSLMSNKKNYYEYQKNVENINMIFGTLISSDYFKKIINNKDYSDKLYYFIQNFKIEYNEIDVFIDSYQNQEFLKTGKRFSDNSDCNLLYSSEQNILNKMIENNIDLFQLGEHKNTGIISSLFNGFHLSKKGGYYESTNSFVNSESFSYSLLNKFISEYNSGNYKFQYVEENKLDKKEFDCFCQMSYVIPNDLKQIIKSHKRFFKENSIIDKNLILDFIFNVVKNPYQTDEYGNTILHHMFIGFQSDTQFLDKVIEHYKEENKLDLFFIKNKANQTIFDFILKEFFVLPKTLNLLVNEYVKNEKNDYNQVLKELMLNKSIYDNLSVFFNILKNNNFSNNDIKLNNDDIAVFLKNVTDNGHLTGVKNVYTYFIENSNFNFFKQYKTVNNPNIYDSEKYYSVFDLFFKKISGKGKINKTSMNFMYLLMDNHIKSSIDKSEYEERLLEMLTLTLKHNVLMSEYAFINFFDDVFSNKYVLENVNFFDILQLADNGLTGKDSIYLNKFLMLKSADKIINKMTDDYSVDDVLKATVEFKSNSLKKFLAYNIFARKCVSVLNDNYGIANNLIKKVLDYNISHNKHYKERDNHLDLNDIVIGVENVLNEFNNTPEMFKEPRYSIVKNKIHETQKLLINSYLTKKTVKKVPKI